MLIIHVGLWVINLPGEYETDTEGDSGSTEQTNLSALLRMKGLELELLLIRSCQTS